MTVKRRESRVPQRTAEKTPRKIRFLCKAHQQTKLWRAVATHLTACILPPWSVVVVRVGRPLRRLRRVLLKGCHRHFNSLFKLRIASLAPGLRIHLHFDVGRDTVVLNLPLAFRTVERKVPRSYRATVYEHRITADANQPAPRPLSDKRADAVPSEHPGHVIASTAGILVDDHHFRTRKRTKRLTEILAVAHGPVAVERFSKVIDDVVCRAAAAIESLVNYCPLFMKLRKVVTVEIGVPAPGSVGQPDVGQLATAHLIDLAAIPFDPGECAQPPFVSHWHDGDFARAGTVRIGTDADHDLLVCGVLKETVNVLSNRKIAAVHREQVLACLNVDSGLRQWSAQLRVPILTVVYFGEAIATVLNRIVCAQQSSRHALRIGHVASLYVEMAHCQLAKHFLKEITQISAVSERRQVGLVFPGRSLQVEAVMVRVIKEVTLNAPGFAIHLLPLGFWIDIDLHVFGFDFPFARLDWLCGGRNHPIVALAKEHLFTVGRKVKAAKTVEHFLKLALFHVELVKRDPCHSG